jgi:acyl-CoA thioester hydrolase
MSESAPSPRPFLVKLEFQPKTYDIDFAGVVSNIAYLRWLEDMRLAVLAEHLPLDGLMRQGLGPTLASTYIEYKMPIRLFDRVQGVMWSSQIDERRWTLSAELTVKGKLAARSEQVGAFVDLATTQAVPTPADILKRYRAAIGADKTSEADQPTLPISEPIAWLTWTDAETGKLKMSPIGPGGAEIGRAPRCQAQVEDQFVARHHARIAVIEPDSPGQKPECVLRDLGARNGTFLNGKRVETSQTLKNGDKIRVGETEIEFSPRPS